MDYDSKLEGWAIRSGSERGGDGWDNRPDRKTLGRQ